MNNGVDAAKAKQQLREDLLAMAPLFAENALFMSASFHWLTATSFLFYGVCLSLVLN